MAETQLTVVSPAQQPAIIPKRRRGWNRRWASGVEGDSVYDVKLASTQFEELCARLGLKTEGAQAESQALQRWAEVNADRRYVPEWLLNRWGITVCVYEAGL